ncbi:hypothetical protein M8C21_004156 [Ambrosia artemisiifolia]|uniref:Cytochrome P450 n=1 Tax=Ambrosia artemisiifolia TaxID=4212 RepID=A0AAD5G361_AMBAR|nr:hypothetical protein M8C21_004156 [Ambrosia artemisiifolia]
MSNNNITSSSSPPLNTSLPVREIPGSYGLPLLGPLTDRLNYSWFQGPETFFRKRIEKNKSTVFRTNVPPSFPFFVANPNVVAVLDCKSFAHMFDMELVEKKNILVGDWMPSTRFTGDRRVCAYLDTSEPQHEQLKNFAMDTLKRSSTIWVPTLTTLLDTMWDTIESELDSGPVSYLVPIQKFIFAFASICIAGADPANSSDIADKGYIRMDRWLALQLLPIVPITVFQPLVEIFLHSFPYPYFLVSRDYNKLHKFIENEGKEVISRAQTEFKLTSDETGVQEKLRKEVREKAGSGSGLSLRSVQEMELVQSFVYETLRLNPPVPLQYGRARKDFELSSHDSVFKIKKGELLCGFQPLVMRDPKVFDDPETFVPDRFTGEKGKELLTYLYWSNGPQTGMSSGSNKQCAAKDYVPLTTSLFLAHMFMRYDSVAITNASFTAVDKPTP